MHNIHEKGSVQGRALKRYVWKENAVKLTLDAQFQHFSLELYQQQHMQRQPALMHKACHAQPLLQPHTAGACVKYLDVQQDWIATTGMIQPDEA